MRPSDLITRLIDWFYIRPVAAIVPRQVFRYAVCGGMNVVFGWVCYFLIYNYLIDKQLVDLGFVAVSAHVMAMLLTFPLTFFAGFWLNRNSDHKHVHIRINFEYADLFRNGGFGHNVGRR